MENDTQLKPNGMRTVLWLIVVIVVAALGFTWSKQTPSKTIKIGFIGPLSGELASWGENQRMGIELARSEVNASGGVEGISIEVIYEDSKCDPKLGVSAAQKLIEVDKVSVIIGDTCSSSVLAIAPLTEAHKIVLISPTAGSDKISAAGDYVFRNFLTNKKYAEFAALLLAGKKVALFYINNDFGVNLREVFIRAFKGNLVFNEGYAPDAKDFRSSLVKIKANNPQIILLAGYYPDGALILKQAKELGIAVPFLGGGDGYDDTNLIALSGSASERFRFLSVPFATGPAAQKFLDLYKKRYDKDPLIYSDYAFDTFMVIVEAMRKSGISSSDIRTGLYTVDYNGASNRVRFDENGDLLSPSIITKEVRDGQFVVLDDAASSTQ